jgi:hypothetical protein
VVVQGEDGALDKKLTPSNLVSIANAWVYMVNEECTAVVLLSIGRSQHTFDDHAWWALHISLINALKAKFT